MTKNARAHGSRGLGRDRSSRPEQLPVGIYHDLVGMLFSMALPIMGLGVAFVAVASLIAVEWAAAASGFAVAGALITIARFLVILGYRKAQPTGIAALKKWERRYAIGNYAFAALLGTFSLWGLSIDNPMLHLIIVSLVFAFAAGLVSRISVRPEDLRNKFTAGDRADRLRSRVAVFR